MPSRGRADEQVEFEPVGRALHVLRHVLHRGGCPRAASPKAPHCLFAEIRGERVERIPNSEEAFEQFRALHAAADARPPA